MGVTMHAGIGPAHGDEVRRQRYLQEEGLQRK
jgi:hypothetical protein